MKKLINTLILLLSIVTFSTTITSCGSDEPEIPENTSIDIPNNSDDHGDSNVGSEEIPGAKILGTWYYLSPDKAIKITIRFSSEKGYNYVYLGDRVCYISVESEFPYYHTDYANVWQFEDDNWHITRLEVLDYLFSSATITKVFDDEMWLDFEYGKHDQRLKFKRSDPGNPIKPNDKQLAPDGIWGRYVWSTTIGRYNMTFQFIGSEGIKETSDSDVWVYYKGESKKLKESIGDAGYKNGLLRIDWSWSLIDAATEGSYFVVIKETDKRLILYNPFSPDVRYLFTR